MVYRKTSILDSLETDTGFNVICVSCREFKSRNSCVRDNGSRFTKLQESLYLHKDVNITLSIDGKYYVCLSCQKQIKEGKRPKRSDIQALEFCDFPLDFIRNVKEKCGYENIEDCKLNKLEGYLFKNPIPFMRIANCRLGQYMKVVGNLIMITSDLEHTFCKILPVDQQIIPVSLKRKLSYQGYYIEEWVDSTKLSMYFVWFKDNNPFFKDLAFDLDALNRNVQDIAEDIDKYIGNASEVLEDELFNESSDIEDNEQIGDGDVFLNDNPIWINDTTRSLYYDSILLNKYEVEIEEKSPLLKYANIILEYEINNDIEYDFSDDLEIEPEDVKDEIDSEIDDMMDKKTPCSLNMTMKEAKEKAAKCIDEVSKKMEKISIAPGEHGQFRNWGQDVFLEEKMFPHLFPFGIGGYMSSALNEDKENMGFSNYVRHRILSADSRYRKDSTYLFFLLIVKEIIDLNRSKQTYLRQAQKLPHMTLTDFQNVSSKENLARYNRSFEVFKSLRGTSPYYEQAKKNLMAILRQRGCPSLFFTLSCAEYKWDHLIKEIIQVNEKRMVDIEEVKKLSSAERNKILIENPVISTLHFNKRAEKIFRYFKTDEAFAPYFMVDYFYRVEFQARGAPHLHSLIYLEEEIIDQETGLKKRRPLKTMFEETDDAEKRKEVITNIEKYAKNLICSSMADIHCEDCEINNENSQLENCETCKITKSRVSTNNTHSCRFSCHKKKREMVIKCKEGHGKLDGIKEGPELRIPICRYGYPKDVMKETTFIPALPKSIDEESLSQRKSDYKKIRKTLIRDITSDGKREENEQWSRLQQMTYDEYLDHVGMVSNDNTISMEDRISFAHKRYLEALSVSIRGNGAVFPKRECADIFTNNFCSNVMSIHDANHDIQIVSDPWACGEYMTDYITKAEQGMSPVLESLNRNEIDLTKMNLLDKIAENIDKKREVSVQEGTYRCLGLPMVKSSVKVKYVNTCHLHKRDGLLKGKIAELKEGDSPFHDSIFEYYESRPYNNHASEGLMKQCNIESFEEMCLADFISCLDIIYGSKGKQEDLSVNEYELLNNKGRIKLRSKRAVLCYYLKYESEIEMKRGKLILFLPFRREMKEIHDMDIEVLYDSNVEEILANQAKFEFKFEGKSMTDILKEIEERREQEQEEVIPDDEFEETTTVEEIKDFEKRI